MCQLACDFFHKQLMVAPQGQEARDYLTSRGLDSDARIDFSLGYAPASSEIFLTAMHSAKRQVGSISGSRSWLGIEMQIDQMMVFMQCFAIV